MVGRSGFHRSLCLASGSSLSAPHPSCMQSLLLQVECSECLLIHFLPHTVLCIHIAFYSPPPPPLIFGWNQRIFQYSVQQVFSLFALFVCSVTLGIAPSHCIQILCFPSQLIHSQRLDVLFYSELYFQDLQTTWHRIDMQLFLLSLIFFLLLTFFFFKGSRTRQEGESEGGRSIRGE